MVPLFNSTLRFAIVRPRPVPDARVEKYGSNSRRDVPRRPCRRPCRSTSIANGVIGARVVTSVRRPAARHRVQRVLHDVDERAGEQRPVEQHVRQVRREAVSMRPRPAGAARYGASTSLDDVVDAGPAPAWPPARWQSSRTPTRSAAAAAPATGSSSTQLSSTGESGSPRSWCTRRRCSAESWMGVSGFLMSCATWRAMSAHASRRFVRSSSPRCRCRSAAIPLNASTRRLNSSAEVDGNARIEIAARDAARGARQPVHRIGDALRHRVADRGAEQDEAHRGQQHAPIEGVDLALGLLLPQRERHGHDRARLRPRAPARPRSGRRSGRPAPRRRSWPAARARSRDTPRRACAPAGVPRRRGRAGSWPPAGRR